MKEDKIHPSTVEIGRINKKNTKDLMRFLAASSGVITVRHIKERNMKSPLVFTIFFHDNVIEI